MTDLLLSGEAADKLRQLAEREQRPVDEVVLELIERYTPAQADETKQEVDDPLIGLIGLLDNYTDATDMSTTVRETLKQYTHPQYGWTKRGRTD